MKIAKVTFQNGEVITTPINGTEAEIQNYYKVGRYFNLGNGAIGQITFSPSEENADSIKCTMYADKAPSEGENILRKKMTKKDKAIATIEIAKHMNHELKVFKKKDVGSGYVVEKIDPKFGYNYMNLSGWHVQLVYDRDWAKQIEVWSKVIQQFKKVVTENQKDVNLHRLYAKALEQYEAGVFMNDPEYSFEVLCQAMKDLVLFTDK